MWQGYVNDGMDPNTNGLGYHYDWGYNAQGQAVLNGITMKKYLDDAGTTPAADTDWYDELLRTALMTNHSLTISGGSERATYSLGMSYLYQDGIMDTDNNYNRLNFRAQVDYQATNWMKVGFNGVFSQGNQRIPKNNAWQVAYNAPGIFPVYDESRGDEIYPVKYASPTQIGINNNIYNPVATANFQNSQNKVNQYLANFYAEFNLVPDKLTFRTSYGKDFSTIRGRTFTEPYYVAGNSFGPYKNSYRIRQMVVGQYPYI